MKTEKAIDHVKTFLALIRVRNCTMTYIGVLLGASFINPGDIFTFKVLLAAAAAFVITGAGNVINDYYDYEIDKINRPHRAIPSNKISKSDAWMLSVTMFAIGLGMSNVNVYCLGLAICNTAVLIVYGKYSKRMYLLANLIVSYLVASIFIYGALANVSGEFLELEKTQLVAILSGCAFFATLSREIVKDIEDMEGDKKKYSVTLPIQMGAKRARDIASTFLLTAIALSALPLLIPSHYFNTLLYLVPVAIADLIFLSSMNMRPAPAQKTMILGMTMAIIAFFAGEIGTKLL